MAEISKQALKVENNTSFPNNNNGAITPTLLRGFNTDMIDSLVDEIGYTADSASWNQQIDALEQFTASVVGISTGSLLVTASAASNVITFTKGDASTFNVTIADTTNLTPLNNFTASAQISLNNLNTWTSSYQPVIVNLQASQSIDNTKFDTLSAYTASNDVKWTDLQTHSSSWVTSAITASSLVTASILSNVITFTKGDNTTFNITVNTGSGGGGSTDISSLNAFTQSQDTKNSTLASVTASLQQQLTNIGGQSGSWITESETSSFARTNVDNNFTANQTFTNITAVSASFQYVQTTYETSSVIYSSGSNQFGDAADDIQTLYGQVRVINALTASGLNYPTADNGEFSFIQTDGAGNLSLQYVNTVNDNVYNAESTTIVRGTPLFVSGSQGANPKVFRADASNPLRMPVTYVAGDNINAGVVGRAIILGQIDAVNTTGFPEGSEIYVAEGGGWTSSRPSGSNSVVQLLGIVTFESAGGKGLVLNPGPATLPNIQTGYVWVGNGNNAPIAVATSSLVTAPTDITALNAFTASQETKDLTLAAYTASNDTKWTTLGALTGSYATTGSNVFRGDETFEDAAENASTLVPTSGSLMLVAKGFTSASAHLSASAANQINLIFKNNNNTADTIISGSNNIFVNAAAPTAGFKRYIGGSNNIFNSTGLPQISGSMGFSPIMGGNIGIGSYTFRGPVSSSAWNINSNYNAGTVAIGASAVLNAEKLTGGLNLSANLIQGTLTINANQSALTGSNTTFLNNSMNGNATLNLSSSAVAMSNNIINDSGFILTNQFYSSSVGLGVVNTNRNTIGGQSNQIITTGTLPTGTTTGTSISDNVILGGNNILFVDSSNARVSGSTAYHNAVRNSLIGNQLIVSGSGLLSDASSFGSVFVGRYNADDARRNKTSDVVFAVGTGNTGARKTGFLIDSGSNTFVEGTLNVSGATSLNGDLVITGSLTSSLQQGYVWVGDASGKTTTVATSSFGGGGGFPYTGNAVITGSLGISGSMFGGVIALAVASNTASLDFSQANMFTLNLPSSATTHIAATNIRAGQTINLQVSQSSAATGSIAFAPNIKFAGGYDYTASPITGALDLVSFVAFDTNQVLATAVKNLL